MDQPMENPPSGRKEGDKRREGSAGRRAAFTMPDGSSSSPTDPPSNPRNRPDSPAAGRSLASTTDTRLRRGNADDDARLQRDAGPSSTLSRVGDDTPKTKESTGRFLPPSTSMESGEAATNGAGQQVKKKKKSD